MADEHDVKAAVRKAFLDLMADYAARGEGSLEALMARVADEATGFGTGRHEVLPDRQAIWNQFEQERAEVMLPLQVEARWIRVQLLAPTVAVVLSEMEWTVATADAGEPVTLFVRCSMAMVRRADCWQLAHSHISMPATEQAEDEYFPVDAIRARNEELERLVAERTSRLRSTLDALRAAQRKLIHAEKMASLGQLTAGIAHEIKNPLNFVNNFAAVSGEMIEELQAALRDGDVAAAEEILADLAVNTRKVEEHGRRADGIVKSMMAHAQGVASRPEVVDLNALVGRYVDLAYHGWRAQHPDVDVDVVTELDEALEPVEVLPQELGRVLLNLVVNALDAVAELAAHRNGAAPPRVTITTQRVPGGVEVRVADSGPGVSAALQEKIFEPFFTTKPVGQGTGLGLSLSYEIVTKGHSGALTLENAPGQGAVFIVRLPLRQPASA